MLEGKDIVNVSIYFMVVSGDRLCIFHLMSRVLIFQCLPLIRVLLILPSALKECSEILRSISFAAEHRHSKNCKQMQMGNQKYTTSTLSNIEKQHINITFVLSDNKIACC